jgi:hypothetical protein
MSEFLQVPSRAVSTHTKETVTIAPVPAPVPIDCDQQLVEWVEDVEKEVERAFSVLAERLVSESDNREKDWHATKAGWNGLKRDLESIDTTAKEGWRLHDKKLDEHHKRLISLNCATDQFYADLSHLARRHENILESHKAQLEQVREAMNYHLLFIWFFQVILVGALCVLFTH